MRGPYRHQNSDTKKSMTGDVECSADINIEIQGSKFHRMQKSLDVKSWVICDIERPQNSISWILNLKSADSKWILMIRKEEMQDSASLPHTKSSILHLQYSAGKKKSQGTALLVSKGIWLHCNKGSLMLNLWSLYS